jgi:hypothetical protein
MIELADAFLDLAKGYDLPVGSVVVLSSLSLLARMGTAAYAEEVVRSFARLRDAYGSSIRVVHGFPVLVGGLEDEPLIRSMREIECWFHDVDKKRLHSLPDTSAHFVTDWLTCKKDKQTATDIHPRPLRLPTSLHSLEKGSFLSPGWEDLATSLPILQEEDEGNFLGIMLEEINSKFALQLDPYPSTERSGQQAPDQMGESPVNIVFAGSSHSARTLDQFDRDGVTIFDATVPGFRLNPDTAAEMAEEVKNLTADLCPENTVVIIQVLDNSTYYCGTEYGEMTLPKKGTDRRYHIVGELRFLKKSSFRELSAHLLLIIKAAGKAQVIIWIPLPRWLHFACCMDPSHLINRGDTDFIENMHEALRDLRCWLEDMIDLRKLANVSLYNPCDALNMTGPDMDVDRALELWGNDPVHPSEAGYAALAQDMRSLCETTLAEARARNAAAAAPIAPPQQRPPARPARREGWIAGSTPVAKRFAPNNPQRGNNNSRPWFPRANRGRGHRGGGAANPPRGGGPLRPPTTFKRGFKGRGWGRGSRRPF